MKSKKLNKLALTKYLRVFTLLFVIGCEVFIGYALLVNSHASTVYTVPDTRNDANPNAVIDPTGVKDSSAGLQAFINSVPNGTKGNNNSVVFPGGAKYRVNDSLKIVSSYVTYTTNPNNKAQIFADSSPDKATYPWRARPAANNVGARQANWFMDEYPDILNHAVLGGKTCAGCTTGGYDGYQSGFELDPTIGDTTYNTPFVLASYNQHPFIPSDVGKVITVCSPNNGCLNRIIASVINCATPSYDSSGCSTTADAQGKFNAVKWSADQAKQADNFKMSSSGWVSWAIGAKGDWECYFGPNPSFRLKTYSGSWSDYNDAQGCAIANNRGRTLVSLGGAYNQWLGIDIHGPNTQFKGSILGFKIAAPSETEFQHTMSLSGDNNEVSNSYIGDAYGDAIVLGATHLWVHGNRIQNTGRQGFNASGKSCGVIIENNIIQRTHHSMIDFEPGQTTGLPGCKYNTDWFAILNNTIGGPHGFAANPGGNGNFGHIKFSGNHSLNSDVAAGTIEQTSGWNRATTWGSPAPVGYFIMTNNISDAPSLFSYGFKNWTHVYVANNQQDVGRADYYTLFTDSDHYLVQNNTERNCTTTCLMKGQVDPASTKTGTGFNMPGTADVDSWWANNGPDPSNYYRDNANPPPPVDTTAPSVPGGLKVVSVNSAGVGLNWQASTDNVGVKNYNVYRKIGTGSLIKIGTNTGLSFIDYGVAGGTTYSYQVSAVDAAGNESAKSSSVTATVPNATQYNACDINQDGKVDILDFSLLIKDYGKTGTTLGRADINKDTRVDILDFSLLIDQYGK